MGFLSIVLMAWDYENNRMVALMGMGWDMGPPLWPYQWVSLLLFVFNVPAFLLADPILAILRLNNLGLQYAVWFPLIVGLWWWIGKCVDFGFLRAAHIRYRRIVTILLCAATFGLVAVSLLEIVGLIQWYVGPGNWGYGPIATARTMGPVAWYLIFAALSTRAAVRLFRDRGAFVNGRHLMWRLWLGVTTVAASYFATIALVDHALTPVFDYNYCAYDRLHGLGCTHGTVTDSDGKAVAKVEVDLIPLRLTGDARRWRTETQRTDEMGRYNFNRVQPGEYWVAVNAFSGPSAPDAEHPYATVYYPRASDEASAEVVKIKAAEGTYLSSLETRTLETTRMRIRVAWQDGMPPKRSNIYARNTLYENSAVTAPQIDDGDGEIVLPVGFEYEMFASVECELGAKLESRESKPYRIIKAERGGVPSELFFEIPGTKCTLWKP